MRVLQVLPGLKTDGIAVVVTNYYKFIDKNKIQFDFAVENKLPNKYDGYIEENGGKIFRLPNHMAKLTGAIRYVNELKKLIKKENYKIVHVHSNSSILLFLAAIAAKRAKNGVKIIFSSHSRSCEQLFLHKVLRPLTVKMADYRFACSSPAGVHMYGKHSFQILSNAIDFEKYAFNNEKREIKRKELSLTDNFVLGFSGRISPPKNPLFLIDVFKIVNQKIPSAKLLICGDGTMTDELKNKIERENVANVILTGSVNSTEDYLSAMDVILAPSLYEGLPMALLEAEANGLFAICSENIPEEAIFSQNVSVIPLDNINCWAKKAEEVYNLKNRGAFLGLSAQTGFDIRAESQKILEFYLSLL